MPSKSVRAGTRAVVLLSGGMDSCVCAALAARDHDAAAVHVSYGQRTETRERRSFDGVCDRLGIGDRLAVSWAEVLGAEKVYIGAVEPDSSGYPDCRPAYYRAYNEVVKAGTKEGAIQIVTPLIAMRKAEIVRLGLELGAPFDLTWSCYQREDRACGVCDSCVLRLRAFQDAGANDPIPYAEMATRSS